MLPSLFEILLITIPELVPSLNVNAPFVTFKSLEPIVVFPVSFEYDALYISFLNVESSFLPDSSLNTYTPVCPLLLLSPVTVVFTL